MNLKFDDCLCCKAGLPTDGPRTCPECGWEFKGNGWDGIDAHWRAKHEDVLPYEDFWRSLCDKHGPSVKRHSGHREAERTSDLDQTAAEEESRGDTSAAGRDREGGGPALGKSSVAQGTDLELYKTILSLWDSEMTRFYSRQNLYIGIQIAAFAGLMAGLKELVEYPGFIRLALLFLFLIGVMTALIATRGLTTQALTTKVIQELENRNEGLDLLSLTKKHTRVYLLTNFVLSVTLAWIMPLLWLAVWIHLDRLAF